MKQDYFKYVENRLYEWAEWFSKDRNGLGYPSSSIEYLFTPPKVKGTQKKPGYITTNKDAEEIEDLIREMSEYNYNMALALRQHYFTGGGLRIKSKNLNISHMQYKNYVDMAHQWLAGRLSANNKLSKNFEYDNS